MQQGATVRWRANENFVLRTIASDHVLVPVGEVPDPRMENSMITLNETCAFLWELFSQSALTEQQAVDAAMAEYDVQPDEVAEDIRSFMISFARVGLLLQEE